MSIARFSVKQVVLVNLLFVVFIATGVAVYTQLPVDVYPDTSLDLAIVETTWPGASAGDIERLISGPIEEKVEEIRGLERLYSYSLPDLSVVGVKFKEDISSVEMEKAFDELRLALDQVTDLPEGAEEPLLQRLTVDEIWPLVRVAIVDDGAGEHTALRIAEELKQELRAISGVSRVRQIAARDREIHILVDAAAMEKYGLSSNDVAAVLQSRNLNVPAGIVKSSGDDIALRSIGEVSEPSQLGEIVVVRNPNGSHVRLRDIARIEDGFERAVWSARYNGKSCNLLYISKEKLSNGISVKDSIQACVDRYIDQYDPPGILIELTGDTTTMISSRLDVLKKNLAVGLVLVFCVLWMVLGFRNSMLAIVGVPFSFLCAFIFMYAIGVSINVVSVFALVLVSGIVVDDAIVILENIYRHIESGKPLQQAVIDGTDEVMWPVISSTLTTIAAFMPLLLMTGVVGKFFSIVPKTVTVTLLASLFECLIILPAHYLDWGRRKKSAPPAARPKGTRPKFWTVWRDRAMGIYGAVLAHVLHHRYLAIAIMGATGVLTWQAQRTLVQDLFPSDFPSFIVDFNAKPGASLEETDRVASQLWPVLDSFVPTKVERYAAALGVQWNEDNQRVLRSNLVQMWLDIPQNQGSYKDPTELINEVRAVLNKYIDDHPDCGIENLRVWPIRDGPPVGKPVAIRVEHPDYAIAQNIAERIKERLNSFDGVFDVTDNLQAGYRELQLHLKEQRAAELGVTYAQVASALRGAGDGLKVGIFKDIENGEDLDIKVRLSPESTPRLEDLQNVTVSSAGGRRVKLHQVAELNFEQGYASLYHHNGRRAIQITADVDTYKGVDAGAITETVLAEFAALADQDTRLHIQADGQYAETNQSFEGLWRSGLVALGLIYLILAAQFRSYLQPAVIVMAILFGIVGMVMGLVVNGYPFTVVTAVAMVGLCGVVVNDALVLLDFINKERDRGTPLLQALQTSCKRRVRPIMLTTVTTLVGLGPMAFGLGGYSKIWSPFAMSMCWGLALATGLTLILVPAFYYITDDIANLFKRAGISHTAHEELAG